MDVWVVAAAAGASYLAKFLQNVVKDRDATSGSISGNSTGEKLDIMPKLESEARSKKLESGITNRNDESLFQRRVRRQISESNSPNKEDASSVERLSDMSRINVSSSKEMASTSGLNGDSMDGCITAFSDTLDVASTSTARAWQPDFSPKNFTMGSGMGRHRSSLNNRRSRHYYSVKPMTSLESCLIAQIYKDPDQAEEYLLSSVPYPPKSAIKPFVITDGSHVIRRHDSGFSSEQLESAKCRVCVEYGIDAGDKETTGTTKNLLEAGLIELPRKVTRQKQNRRYRMSSMSSRSTDVRHKSSQGSSDRMILFCIGVAFGVISTNISHKREVDNLNEKLKQSQNLVQDLQEELEMRDSFTVKELTNESWESRETIDPSVDPKATGKEEAMSRIEAELEAELERLEFNMNAASIGRRLSGFSEIDPDLVGDLVQGELKDDTTNRANDSENDTSRSSTYCTPSNRYVVSPKELSLRLHEVIQARLEERITELEIELGDARRRLHAVEAENMKFRRDFLNSETASPSTKGSPTPSANGNCLSRSLLLNLSSHDLNAYDEAYNEFMRIASPPCENKLESKQIPSLRDHSEGGKGFETRNFESFGYSKMSEWDCSRGSIEIGNSDEDVDDDEMGKLLIKQIVETTRQGSPVVLNAQKVLRAMDSYHV